MEWDEIFKVFSDNTRLRILNLLAEGELNVNELIEILNLQQSRVSKHLKILKEHKMVQERRNGTWRFYSLEEKSFTPAMTALLDQAWSDKPYAKDREKVKYILEKRKLFAEDFFQSNHGAMAGLGSFYSLENLLIAFSMLLPDRAKVLDGGCGEGKLLWYLAHNTKLDVYGIDVYKSVFQNTVFKDSDDDLKKRVSLEKSDLTNTPFKANFFDIVFTNMVLHHISEPRQVFKEMSRVLKPGGKWLIIDFFKHNNEAMREDYKDFWLGFSIEEMEHFCKDSGLTLSNSYLIPQDKKDGETMPDNIIILFEKP